MLTGAAIVSAAPPTPISDDVLARAKNASVMVLLAHSKSAEADTPLGSGSGYFVNSTGLAVTNNHVADPGHGKSPDEKFKLKEELGRQA